MKEHEIKALTEEALDAFWQVIADGCPTAKRGDPSPLTTVSFEDAAAAVVAEWIWANVPKKKYGKAK